MLKRLVARLGTWCDYKWSAPCYRLRVDLRLLIIAVFYTPYSDDLDCTVSWLPYRERCPF